MTKQVTIVPRPFSPWALGTAKPYFPDSEIVAYAPVRRPASLSEDRSTNLRICVDKLCELGHTDNANDAVKLGVRRPGTVISAHARTERRKVLRLVLMNPVIRMACKSLLLLPQSTGLAGNQT
jgi:hypothetical protein